MQYPILCMSTNFDPIFGGLRDRSKSINTKVEENTKVV